MIRWSKKDVIKAFQEVIGGTSQENLSLIQRLKDIVKRKGGQI